MLTTTLKSNVRTRRLCKICAYLSLSLICSLLLLQLWVSVRTPNSSHIKPKVISYRQPNNKSLQFDHQPKNNSSNLNYKPKHIFDYTFPLAEPLTCFNGSRHPRPVFLLVFIPSSSGNYERRQAIRETWGSPKEILGKNIVTVFLLGNGTPKLQDLQESSTHHDIIHADFIDTYKNLTIKTIMGMKWIHTYCSHASYFMKTDDDMYVSYANLIKKLLNPSTPTTDFAMGHFYPQNEAIRTKGHKVYVPQSMYKDKFYPPYLAGGGYVMSGDLASKIYRVSPDVKYITLEDVFVGLCLKALHVMPIGHSGFTYLHINYEVCEYRNHRISSHGIDPEAMHRIWNDLKENPHPC